MLDQLAQQIDARWRPGASWGNSWSSNLSFSGLIESTSAVAVFPRGVEVYGEGEPADYCFMVIGGAVRTYKVLVDGRRQISAFHLRGDIFGLEFDKAYSLSADTIRDSSCYRINRSALMAKADCNNEVARQLLEMTGCELKRVQAHTLMLIKTARERVAEFLIEMSERMPKNEGFALPMSRRDIADYLGLTIETVSRTLSDLEKEGAILLRKSRQVVLRDYDALVRVP
jgi:CRP/FNR family transcriptional regulator, nitrogen fixation regulation protein